MGTAQIPSRLNQYKVGPEPDGIRVCITCGHEIGQRQVWLKVWTPGSEYAVGIHAGCRDVQSQQRGPEAAKFNECSLCGHMTKDTAQMAVHFRLVHRLAFGVSLDRLAA